MYLPYNVVQALGFHLEQLTYGIWFMAAVVAIIPKPGIALILNSAGAGETIVKGEFSIPTIVYAILQGLACEVVFAILNTNHVL